ncbi:MAG: hypothetical protein AB1486_03330 [Planctomycetota bacterium]
MSIQARAEAGFHDIYIGVGGANGDPNLTFGANGGQALTIDRWNNVLIHGNLTVRGSCSCDGSGGGGFWSANGDDIYNNNAGDVLIPSGEIHGGDNVGVPQDHTFGDSDSRIAPVDFWWDWQHRRVHTRSLILTEVGDPPDLALQRAGGTWPNGPLSGITAGESLGAIYWRGWGTSSSFELRSAQIYCRAAEDLGPEDGGGDLLFGTLPRDYRGGPEDRMVIRSDGTVEVFGHLSKGSGSFKIDHPLYPAEKYLYHSLVESPDMMNIYNGNVVLDRDGEAWVELPPWFEALNRDFRYQPTAVGSPAPDLHVAQTVSANRFKIAGGTKGLTVSWQVTGIRCDPYANLHRVPVEADKPVGERGTYLHPEAYADAAVRVCEDRP